MTTPLIVWSQPPEHLRLDSNQVYFWRAFLSKPAASVADFYRILSFDEIERAGKYRFRKDHDRYVAAHGILRIILGKYLKKKPSCIFFKYNKYGKPALSGLPDNVALCFNVSHSKERLCMLLQRSVKSVTDERNGSVGGSRLAEKVFKRGTRENRLDYYAPLYNGDAG